MHTGINPDDSRHAVRACSTSWSSQKLDGYVLFDEKVIQYFTNFGILATEGPSHSTARRRRLAVFVPEFEVERVREETDFDRVESYPDSRDSSTRCSSWRGSSRPGMRRVGPTGRLPRHPRLRGPALSERRRPSRRSRRHGVADVRKSAAEVELIRESARWCEHAHRLLQEYSLPGATEAKAGLRAGHEATLAMLAALGGALRRRAGLGGRGVGRLPRPDRPAELWAHAVAHNIEFQGR